MTRWWQKEERLETCAAPGDAAEGGRMETACRVIQKQNQLQSPSFAVIRVYLEKSVFSSSSVREVREVDWTNECACVRGRVVVGGIERMRGKRSAGHSGSSFGDVMCTRSQRWTFDQSSEQVSSS